MKKVKFSIKTIFNQGLDELSSSQCVDLLRRIAKDGRTVICSIHTPSAKIFEMFDHIYVLTNGQCIYQGKGQLLVPYAESVGLKCPKSHNPADFSKFGIKVSKLFLMFVGRSFLNFFAVIKIKKKIKTPQF